MIARRNLFLLAALALAGCKETPDTSTCPLDDAGTPDVVCTGSGDCADCDADHQACDLDRQSCVQCTAANLESCLVGDVCVDATCSFQCPSTCIEAADCGSCPGADSCFDGRCSECALTSDCDGAEQCVGGVCVSVCGQPSDPGSCLASEDCVGCQPDSGSSPWGCEFPPNGGVGFCSPPPLSGCGTELAPEVLPSGWASATTPCSSPADCGAAVFDQDLGAAIADAWGSTQITLHSGATVTIAALQKPVPLNQCAAVAVGASTTCGICVACAADSDCGAVDLSQDLNQLLLADSLEDRDLAQRALWGEADPIAHLRCQTTAPELGVCVPCPNPMMPCTGN